MNTLLGIVLRFLGAFLGRWISWGIIKKIVTELFNNYKVIVLVYISDFLKELLLWVLDNVGSEDVKHPLDAIKRFLLEGLGIHLDEFSKEGMKKAAGQLIADKVNLKYGTNFSAFYPPENIIEQIKAQLLAEIMEAVE